MKYLLFIGFIFSLQVNAGMSLSQAIIYFEEKGTRSEDVEVFNHGDETLYVRIEPSIIHNPGMPNEKREIYRNPHAAGLLVTPQRLVIAPGARKRLRFVRLDDVKTASVDKVFRVLVKPEVGEVKSEQTAVKLIVAYEVLVLSQPNKAGEKLKTEFSDNLLTFTNLGNTNILLQKGTQCPKGQSIEDKNNECVELDSKRIYAGNTWSVKIPFDTFVNYQTSVAMDNKIMRFKPEKKNKPQELKK